MHFFGPYLYRSAFGSSTEEQESERALAHLEQVIALEGPSTVAAIILESIPGTAGIMLPPAGYLKGVRELCDRHGIVYIADEVCRTFAERPYPGGLTYSGHPLACAAVVATIETMEDEKVVEHAAHLGEAIIGPGLRALADRHDWIGEVRGTGAFWAVELVQDRTTRAPLAPYGGTCPEMTAIVGACIDRGLLPFTNFNRVHVVPPLTTTAAEAERGLGLMDDALTDARRWFEPAS